MGDKYLPESLKGVIAAGIVAAIGFVALFIGLYRVGWLR